MLDTANSYDDKVAVMRISSDDAGRASNVFKNMMKDDMGNNFLKFNEVYIIVFI